MVRFKNRWLLVEFLPVLNDDRVSIAAPTTLDGRKVYNALKHSVVCNFGDTGWGAVGLSMSVKYFSPMTNVCIIRVAREQHKVAWGAVTLLSAVDGQRVVPNVVHVSGTIRHAQLAAIKHNREVVARYRALVQTPGGFEAYLETSTTEIEALRD
ncbi:hypothetical protein AX14_000832 [Amanita brunnescens Koide BX004]|nr:hypothetical protein AX14_000832 [Amanita brunnescens Koide BX004]